MKVVIKYAKKVKNTTKEEKKSKETKGMKPEFMCLLLIIMVWILCFTVSAQGILYSKMIIDLKNTINTKESEIETNTQIEKIYTENKEQTITNEINKSNIDEQKIQNKKKDILEIGKLSIPDIKLKQRPIYEGTDEEILNKGIGHFTNTNICNGNVGLASHNSGGQGDDFKNLKQIKIGSEIYYETKYSSKKYVVEKITEISDQDWSWLEQTKDNRITLLTCVSGKPNNRLCVQGIEIM